MLPYQQTAFDVVVMSKVWCCNVNHIHLFNKCIKFTLPSIDSSPRDATTMLYESIIQNSKDDKAAVVFKKITDKFMKKMLENLLNNARSCLILF